MAIIETERPKPYKATVRIHNRQKSKSFSRKIDAERWEREMLVKRDSGNIPAFQDTSSLEQLRNRFEKDYAALRQSPSTQITEAAIYRNHIKPTLGQARISRITEHDIESLLTKLKHGGMSNERTNRVRQMLSCMLNQAVKWRLISRNPVSVVEKFPEKDYQTGEEFNYITQDEGRKILAWLAVNDNWLYVVIQTLLNTGLRYGEAAALRVRDITFGPHGASVKVGRTYCKHSYGIRETTKGGRTRLVPLGSNTTEFLRGMVGGKMPDDPVLWDTWNEAGHYKKAHRHFRKAIKATKVNDITLHDLRHSFAVHFLENGGDIYHLMNVLGHRSIRLTMRYAKFSKVMAEQVRGRVDFTPDVAQALHKPKQGFEGLMTTSLTI